MTQNKSLTTSWLDLIGEEEESVSFCSHKSEKYSSECNYASFSNWWPTPGGIKYNMFGKDVVFPTAEHLLIAHKTMYTEEPEVEFEKFVTSVLDQGPGEIKAWGRSLKFKEGGLRQWDLDKVEIQYKVLMVKFRYDRVFAKALFKTGSLPIYEDASYDKEFGTGTEAESEWTYFSRETWGKNILGKSLVRLRANRFGHDEWAKEMRSSVSAYKLVID